jgi:hypothetical protein
MPRGEYDVYIEVEFGDRGESGSVFQARTRSSTSAALARSGRVKAAHFALVIRFCRHAQRQLPWAVPLLRRRRDASTQGNADRGASEAGALRPAGQRTTEALGQGRMYSGRRRGSLNITRRPRLTGTSTTARSPSPRHGKLTLGWLFLRSSRAVGAFSPAVTPLRHMRAALICAPCSSNLTASPSDLSPTTVRATRLH